MHQLGEAMSLGVIGSCVARGLPPFSQSKHSNAFTSDELRRIIYFSKSPHTDHGDNSCD